MENKKAQPQKNKTPKKKRLSKKARRRRRVRIAIVTLPIVIVVLAAAALIGSAVLFRVEGFSLSGEGRYEYKDGKLESEYYPETEKEQSEFSDRVWAEGYSAGIGMELKQ